MAGDGAPGRVEQLQGADRQQDAELGRPELPVRDPEDAERVRRQGDLDGQQVVGEQERRRRQQADESAGEQPARSGTGCPPRRARGPRRSRSAAARDAGRAPACHPGCRRTSSPPDTPPPAAAPAASTAPRRSRARPRPSRQRPSAVRWSEFTRPRQAFGHPDQQAFFGRRQQAAVDPGFAWLCRHRFPQPVMREWSRGRLTRGNRDDPGDQSGGAVLQERLRDRLRKDPGRRC